jgi:3-oxoacyl-[acyl-carrier-protein] synthase III
MNFVKIIGTGRYTPENIVTNNDIAEFLDTSDEWIRTRTGISERRISKNENVGELGLKASKEALKKAGLDGSELDLIIVATTAPDYYMPNIASRLQKDLGAKKAVGFDITAACSGLIFALKTAKQFMQDDKYENVLIVGTEVLSKIVNWQDRNTCVLFGDGASALVLKRDENKNGVISVDIGSDGEKNEVLTCKARNINNCLNSEGNEIDFIDMNGKEVFKFAVNIIHKSVDKILRENNLTKEDIKYVVPHQANIRIIQFAAKKLGIEMEKFYVNLDRYGNTSSASIGIALDEMVDKNMLQKGDKIVLVGFGGGLSWGAALIEW